ncbi:MAG: methylmalonyl Co-A mutase-associated GTPase MeaB [bacterium]
MQLIEGLKKRDLRALAKAISLAENDPLQAEEVFQEIISQPPTSFKVGLTGPPGSGKSTLIRNIVSRAVQENMKVGVLAVDPSSPFSGGALLADRLRIAIPNLDPSRVFIRSLSTRGHLGGLSPGIVTSIRLMDFYGFDLLLLETVGVGQAEVEVMHLADLVGVVLVPNLGDEIQAMKSGLMEVADLFVVNKCTLQGAEKLRLELESLIESSPRFQNASWKPPVFSTDALSGEGISELWSFIRRCPQDPLFQAQLEKKRRRQVHFQIFQSLLNYFRLKAEEAMKLLSVERYSPAVVRELIKKIQEESKEK